MLLEEVKTLVTHGSCDGKMSRMVDSVTSRDGV